VQGPTTKEGPGRDIEGEGKPTTKRAKEWTRHEGGRGIVRQPPRGRVGREGREGGVGRVWG